jgi:hypothetical protein
VPQVRPITKFETSEGFPLVQVSTTTEFSVLSFASTTIPLIATTTKATSTLIVNPEYALLETLFAEKASTTKKRILDEERFGFATTTLPEIVLATTTITRNNIALYESGEEVFAKAIGTGKQIPHYFCTSQFEQATTTDLSLDLQQVLEEEGDVVFENKLNEISASGLSCRTDIRIDRKWQNVQDFNFFPGNEDLILMHLDEGIYVVEIDDRAWQNTQVLYPGQNLMMLVDGNSIFIKDGDIIIEALTELIIP